MKIAHASIPAENPRVAAETLAEMMGGEALRFPPGGPDAWMAWSRDGKIELEVIKRDHVLTYDADQGNWTPRAPGDRRSETHLAICVERPAAEIIEIGRRAGWPTRHCERGGGVFSLTEVWVEGDFMLEFLDPAQTARYEEVVTLENWKRFLPMMEAVD
jgi:hypothetical protein